MSRVAKSPVVIPKGVEVAIEGRNIKVKGKNGSLDLQLSEQVAVNVEEGQVTFAAAEGSQNGWQFAGTMRALVNNMVKGVNEGFEKKLQLVGVGYRAKASGNTLNLTLGFSHPVDYEVPAGVSVDTPSQTEVIVKGANKQLVGQVASEIRAFRPPEPYKGKGIRYSDENIRRKETKKK